MPYYQRVQIMGVTGEAATYGNLPQGDPMSKFSVCVEERWRDHTTGERKVLKTWFRCTAFGQLAMQARKRLPRGTWCFIEGRLRCRTVEGREFWSITVDQFRTWASGRPGGRPEPIDIPEELQD